MRQEGILKNWSLDVLTKEDIESTTNELIRRATQRFDEIGNLKPDELCYENFILPILNLECMIMNEFLPLKLAQKVVANKDLRKLSVEATIKLEEFKVEMAMRKNIYDHFVTISSKTCLIDQLSPELKRFVEKSIIAGKRNGLHLNETARNEITDLKKEISNLATTFQSNLCEDSTTLLFTVDELKGVSDDLIETFEKENDKCKVSLKYPHYFPVVRYCSVPETRKCIETAFQSKCMDKNTEILEKLIELRQRKAELLGYENHAAYVQEIRMAKSPEIVKTFYENLIPKLQPIWEREKVEMLELKERECNENNRHFNGRIDFWDTRYFMNKLEETRYEVDNEKLRQYFPLHRVTKGLFEIYQHLLGLIFTKCDSDKIESWHQEVELFKVQDAETEEILGYFYLDLFPREGKYNHAAVFPLQPGCIGLDGKQQITVCAMVANFSRPTDSKPALLEHSEVETYFHEFGHVMHRICAKTETAHFSGTAVERDFVEAPSQMLENWVWEAEPLRKMSGHYEDNSEIPDKLIHSLVASRISDAGMFNLRQIILGMFDQKIHTTGNANTQELFASIYREILGIEVIPDTNFPASWAHMINYDAQYYGYLWSEVYSMDMFETCFKTEGCLNSNVGRNYRNTILKPGGTKNAMDLLTDFLGREPNNKAFLKSRGIE